ncbi:MBL fold metallo-hydrolase [Pleomorphomonas diazotrophica]|uniref:MBL fold metallo-hydrolase n=1 Tax=Pleomorphomonas diazotrophica TaxID=1166257 RepID=A0A1I4VNH9_9HYPH|nr:MBL fold metallo-hydrolase [Pleomorphomonas diazotrophica]PKR89582.1 MBL fold metallo-hydrolase [Pleomorphomonas diazotrophica]SFN02832.1 N-acyl-phosphatidylethanolamine-hydrolysing phospholipase D [Pleomorphomonas diazotrophica]
MNPYYDPAKTHHTPDGFRDPELEAARATLRDIWAWKREARREGKPYPPASPTPRVAPNLARIMGTETSATFIGHSTVLLRIGGLTLLTDPVFSERASPFSFLGPRRFVPPGIALDELPPVDVVLISHGHYDHLDRASVRRINKRFGGRTLFVAPLGVGALLRRWGISNVVELDWWQSHLYHGLELTLTPARHWSARSFNDRNRMLWGAFAIFSEGFSCYFAGDSGYGAHFRETRERLATHERNGALFDLALMPIGAYEPRRIMKEHHMNPEEAVLAHREVGARRSIAIHWGCFQLTDEALDEPPLRLAAARAAAGLADTDFVALPVGGSWWRPSA